MTGRERPILFSAPMVRALLAGTKTQTRRVVKPKPTFRDDHLATDLRALLSRCPYGQPGDRLWVREAWREWSSEAWHYAADLTILPKGDRELANFLAQRSPFSWESYKWRPSIHMPRAASRITLEITGVRVERIQDISEADARADGVIQWAGEQDTPVCDMQEARLQFMGLWESINGGGSWDANPWVWVVSFKRSEP